MGSWTTVANPTGGAVVTAAWGSSVKDATDMLGSSRPRFRYSRETSGLIGNTAGTITVTNGVNLDTVIHDNDGMCYGNAVHINTPGAWMLGLSAEWLTNPTGWRSISINDVSSGAQYAGDTIPANGPVGSVNSSTYQYVTALVQLAAGQILEPRVAQSSGGSLGLNTTDWGLSLCGFLVSV
jgi:hypothetical protein